MTNHSGSKTCMCARCALVAGGMTEEEASASQAAWEQDCIRKFGFYVHVVGQDPDSPIGFNCHTHGLASVYGHHDFQIVLPLPFKTAHGLVSTLANRVKGGETFVDGQVVSGVVKGFDVKLVEGEETGRTVLRMILPDPKGSLQPPDMEFDYALQYRGTRSLA